MGEIYRRASRVLIWLGPKGHGGDYAMETLSSLSLENIKHTNEAITNSRFWDDMLVLLRREWLSRVWVLQEVVMAVNDPLIGCGHIWVPWTHLAAAFTAVYLDWPGGSSYGEDGLITIRSRIECFGLRLEATRSPGGLARNLADMALDVAVSTKATLPQDMVFALRALLGGFARSTIIPNYSLPVEFIFTVATIIMLCEKGLSIYCYCVVAVRTNLPSWVPDFALQSLSSPYFPAYHRGRTNSCSTFEENTSKFRLLGLSQLGIDGIAFDKVEATYEFGHAHFQRESFAFENASFCWKLCDFAAIAQEATHRKVDESSPGHSLRAFRSHGTFYDLFCRGSDLDGDGGARFDAFTTKFGQSSMYRNDHHSILRDGYTPPSFGALLCSGRRFFVTMTEFVGVAVPSTQVGDLVTVLFGLSLPFVARDHNEHQTFVGAAWVNGVMDGELIPFYEQGYSKEKVICDSINWKFSLRARLNSTNPHSLCFSFWLCLLENYVTAPLDRRVLVHSLSADYLGFQMVKQAGETGWRETLFIRYKDEVPGFKTHPQEWAT